MHMWDSDVMSDVYRVYVLPGTQVVARTTMLLTIHQEHTTAPPHPSFSHHNSLSHVAHLAQQLTVARLLFRFESNMNLKRPIRKAAVSKDTWVVGDVASTVESALTRSRCTW